MVVTDSDMMPQDEVNSPLGQDQDPGNHPFSSLGGQSSIYSLTFDELQCTLSEGGKDFRSMNMDEFINSIWTLEDNQAHAYAQGQTHVTNNNNEYNGTHPFPTEGLMAIAKQASVSWQRSLTLPAPLCQKTVDEVWLELRRTPEEQERQQSNGGGRSGSSSNNMQNQGSTQRQHTLGEMTLEDFLVRAGVVREECNPPPTTQQLSYGMYASSGNHSVSEIHRTPEEQERQQQSNGGGRSGSSSNNMQNQGSTQLQHILEEMTWEDFLVRAAVVWEQCNPPPPTQQPSYGMYASSGKHPAVGPNFGPRSVVGGGIGNIPPYPPLAQGGDASVSNGTRGGWYPPGLPPPAVNYGGRVGGEGGGYGLGMGSPVSPPSDGIGVGQVHGSNQYGMDMSGMRVGHKRIIEGPVEKAMERQQRRMIKNSESAAWARKQMDLIHYHSSMEISDDYRGGELAGDGFAIDNGKNMDSNIGEQPVAIASPENKHNNATISSIGVINSNISEQPLVETNVVHTEENVAGASKECIINSSKLLPRNGIDISLEELKKVSGMKREDAAKMLKVSVSTFKRVCRDYQIPRWPPRKKNLDQSRSGNSTQTSSTKELGGSAPTTQNESLVTIKAKYGDSFIKFKLSTSSKINALNEQVSKRLELEAGSYVVKYQDDDSDWILVVCDDDLRDYISSSASMGKTTLTMLLEHI